MRFLGFLAAAAFALVCFRAEAAVLVHRYTFDVDGSDSRGGLAGTAVNGAEIRDGVLVTGLTSGGEIPRNTAPAFLVPAASVIDMGASFSIESWYTAEAWIPYSTIFAFGTDTRHAITAVAFRDDWVAPFRRDSSLSITNARVGEDRLSENLLGGAYSYNTLTQFIATYDYPTNVASLYVDGTLTAQMILKDFERFQLSVVAKAEGFVAGVGGESPWGDDSLRGSTSDFRLYRGALSAGSVAALHALGPDAADAAVMAAAVPEPGTLALLLGGGLVALAVRRRRR